MKLNLNKEQKVAILSKAIELMELKKQFYMCTSIEMATHLVIEGYDYESCFLSVIRFPELLKYKPDCIIGKDPWFSVDEKWKRINILKEIKEEIIRS